MEQKTPFDTLAHDLRTPLSVIKLHIEVLLLSAQLDAESRENLRAALEQVDRVAELINDFQRDVRNLT